MNKERIIEIKSLTCLVIVGVPKEEREQPQKLSFDIRFAAKEQPEDLQDELSATIDYATIAQRIEKISQERPRCLIETLADEITLQLLEEFPLSWIELTIRKFILPNTDYVAVTVRQEKKETKR